MTPEYGQIAERVGAYHVVCLEAATNAHVAHLITGSMINFIEFEDGFAIAEIHAAAHTHRQTLAESRVLSRFGVAIVGVERSNEDFQHALLDTRVLPADLLIVSGLTKKNGARQRD